MVAQLLPLCFKQQSPRMNAFCWRTCYLLSTSLIPALDLLQHIAATLGRSGYGIILQFRLIVPVQTADAHSLLQHRTVRSSMHSRARLTADAVAQAQRPRSDPTPIHLADCVAPPVFVQLDLGPAIDLRQALLDFDLGPIHPRASVVKWHDATQHALGLVPDWHEEQIQGVSFYTDGSAARFDDTRHAAAAVVRIVHTSDGDSFGGFRCFDTSSDGFAPQAEAAALFVAALWALQMHHDLPAHPAWDIFFHYDCMFAGEAAQGHWQMKVHIAFQNATRALVHWLDGLPTSQVHWQHVRAHAGHPWNEAADAVAWAAVSAWIETVDFALIKSLLSPGLQAFDWIWILERAQQQQTYFPPVQDRLMRINVSSVLDHTPSSDQHPFSCRLEPHQLTGQAIEFTLRCATANVLTLYQNKSATGKYVTARLESLLRAFSQEGVHIVGVQESRSQMTGHSTCLDYHILASPASAKGVGGVQLWVKKHWSIPHGRVNILHTHLRIIAARTQHMIVRLQYEDWRLLVIVGHAPNNPSFSDATKFWTQINEDIPSAMRSWPIVALLDANARVGSSTSKAIDDHGADVENLAGECFHQWLHNQGLFLPQTFASHHDGDHATWHHSSGTTARIDYIAVDRVLDHPAIRTQIANVDLSLHHPDHCSVQMDLPLTWKISSSYPNPPSAGAATVDIPAFSQVQWQCDVHTHLEVPTWGLGVCFTPRVFLPKKKRPRMFLVQEKRPWHGRFIPPSLWKRLRVFPSGAETPAVYRYRFLCISECQKNMKGKGLKEDFRAPTMGPLILRQA